MSTVIVGLNAFHGDSSACLVVDGKLIAAAEEERFRRIKHWAGLPTDAVNYCLQAGGLSLGQVDHIAVNRNPNANILRKIFFTLSRRPDLGAVMNRLANAGRVKDVKIALSRELGVGEIKAEIHNIEHHRAHLASAFLVSPFGEAAVVSVDGFGDFTSTMWGTGKGADLDVHDQVYFPHSLGLLYLAFTQFLGFLQYGDEYKVMGLAPYGRPTMMDKMRKVVKLRPKGGFSLDLDCFIHHSQGVAMTWDDGEPKMGPVFSSKLVSLFGPARKKADPLTQYHKDIAASLQEMYEEAFFHILSHVHKETGQQNLCLAGGCAMNSVANGKVFDKSGFRELYIQSAAGDGGGAIGAAFYLWNQVHGKPRAFLMDHAYWGPGFSNAQISEELKAKNEELEIANCTVERMDDEAALCKRTAERIAQGKVIGWFQGRMEWGPRALGNRSIVCDPRRPDMKDILNAKIKRRESFRPFAPSVVRESVRDWFETDYEVPFMLQVYQVREGKRSVVPAVTHVNGSGRLQTVTEKQNARYYRLIRAFESITGVPIVLNTSFNENEPVVCRPREALDCFLRTRMDVLVMENWFVERRG